MEINLPRYLAPYTSDQLVARVKGKTAGECLNDLARQFPALKEVIFDREGNLYPIFDIYLNGITTYPKNLKAPVKDGDKLSLVYIIQGG